MSNFQHAVEAGQTLSTEIKKEYPNSELVLNSICLSIDEVNAIYQVQPKTKSSIIGVFGEVSILEATVKIYKGDGDGCFLEMVQENVLEDGNMFFEASLGQGEGNYKIDVRIDRLKAAEKKEPLYWGVLVNAVSNT